MWLRPVHQKWVAQIDSASLTRGHSLFAAYR
jgi:hypothetical protein